MLQANRSKAVYMSIPFSRSTRSLRTDSFRASTFQIIVAIAVIAGWAAWLFLARITLYEVTDTARLEVKNSVHQVQSPVFGRVLASNLIVGREVQAGEVLVELDASPERLHLNEKETQMRAYSSQLDILGNEIAAGNQSLEQIRQGATIAAAEEHARYQEAQTAARQASEEARRLAKLSADGLVGELVFLRAQAEAEKSKSVAEARRLAIDRLGKEHAAKEKDQQARVEGLKRQAALFEGEIATGKMTVQRLGNEVDRHFVRAPISGRLGEVAGVQVGAVIREGEKVGTIIPSQELTVVADFAPSAALGRIHSGQQARLRLSGFPWTEYGYVLASVTKVGGEPRSNLIRVEFEIQQEDSLAIPLQHGLPGTVEVEIGLVSPASLLLRTAGKSLAGLTEERKTD